MSVVIEDRRGGVAIRGSGGGGKGGGGSARTPVEQPDSLHNTSYAALLDLVANGEVEGPVHKDAPMRDIYLDGTPIQNADGSLNCRDVQVQIRYGTVDQEYIPGFPASASVTNVGVEVKPTQPWTQLLTNPDLSAVRVSLHWPQLMKLIASGDKTGDRVGYRIEYAIDLAIGSGSFQQALKSEVDGKTVNGYTRTHRIELPATDLGWTVRVRRITSNSEDSNIQDTMFVQSYAEVIDGKFRYPMSAMVGIKIDAEQFQSIPTRAYHWRGQIVRVPSNYNPQTRAYSGVWDGTFKRAWTDNPAWVYYDILLNKLYGLGHRVDASMIDRYALYQIAAYCDQLVSDGQGGQEPRFTCNTYIQRKADALRVLNDLTSVFRGMAYWANGSVVAVADMPSDPIYTYPNAKVLNGRFEYTGADLSTRKTVALVSWNDPSDFYRAKVEVVNDDDGIRRFGIRKTEIKAFACTSRGQAQRAGLYALYTSRMETGGVTFSVGLEGVIPQPGSIIRVADRNRAGRRLGGLVKSATTTEVVFDEPLAIVAGDQVSVILPDGTLETRTVTDVTAAPASADLAKFSADTVILTADMTELVGEVASAQVYPPFSAAPVTGAAWSVDTSTLVAQYFRVVSLKERDGIIYDVGAVAHHPGKHAAIDTGARLDPLPVSVVPPRVQVAPANVLITSHHTFHQGTTRHMVEISWDRAEHAVAYDVQWRRDNGDWVVVPRTGTRLVEIRDVYAGGYTARVRAVNALDVPSLWTYSDLTNVDGIIGAPPVVTSLVATGIVFGIQLSWGFPSAPNIIERTELRYSQTPDFADSIELGSFGYPTNKHTLMNLAAGARLYFWARLVDKNGTAGAWYPSGDGVMGQASTDADKILSYIAGQISQDELAQDLVERLDGFDEDILQNAQAIIDEAQARADAIQAEAQARIDGLQAEAQARADDLTAEAQARGAAITQEKTERQTADSSLSNRIDTNTAAIGDNAAAIQSEETARVNAVSAEANARETLATQMRGSYSGSDLDQVTSGLIGAEKVARSTQYEGLAQQMTLLSAGVGEQFDYARMWYFTGSLDGWTRAELVDGSWVRVISSSSYMLSPSSLAVNGAEYTQARLRVRKVGNPNWATFIGFYAPGNTGSNYTRFDIPEPEWNADQIGMCVLSHTFLDEINQIIVGGQGAATETDYFLFDWISLGRPAPGASSAALANEAQARASADIAEATQRETLSVKLTGMADPSDADLSDLTSGLVYQERQARVMQGQSFAQDLTNLASTVAGKADASALQSLDTRVTDAEGELSAQSDAITQLGSELDDKADASAVSSLTTRVEDVEGEVTAVAEQVTGLDAKYQGELYGPHAGDTDWTAGSTTVYAGTRTVMSVAASDTQALARRVDTQLSQIGDSVAQVEQAAETIVDIENGSKATWRISTQITQDGKVYMAGMALGTYAVPGQPVQSRIYATADIFALLNVANGQITTPFVIQGGQTLISQALIGVAWIKSANIESLDAYKIESTNLAAKLAQLNTAYVGYANIENLAVRTAHIQNLAVDTLKIGNNAVTISAAASGTGSASVTINIGYAASVVLIGTVNGGSGRRNTQILMDSSVVGTVNDPVFEDGSGFYQTGGTQAFRVTTSAANRTFKIEQTPVGSAPNTVVTLLVLVTMK